MIAMYGYEFNMQCTVNESFQFYQIHRKIHFSKNNRLKFFNYVKAIVWVTLLTNSFVVMCVQINFFRISIHVHKHSLNIFPYIQKIVDEWICVCNYCLCPMGMALIEIKNRTGNFQNCARLMICNSVFCRHSPIALCVRWAVPCEIGLDSILNE